MNIDFHRMVLIRQRTELRMMHTLPPPPLPKEPWHCFSELSAALLVLVRSEVCWKCRISGRQNLTEIASAFQPAQKLTLNRYD